MRCPRCHQIQEDGPEECAHCGVVFSRFRPRPRRVQAEPETRTGAMVAWLMDRMFHIEPCESRGMIWIRGGFLVILGATTLGVLTLPMRGPALVGSFLHWIDLPFHEAGHLVFSPFGTFLHILGGTLGQLLVPLVVAGAFLREENPYAASVGVWWLGQSLVDCAPYIADANARLLMLTTGETGQDDWEGHDWFQLLSRTGTLAHDILVARLFWVLGALVMLAALGWGGWVLWRQGRPGCATLEPDGGNHG